MVVRLRDALLLLSKPNSTKHQSQSTSHNLLLYTYRLNEHPAALDMPDELAPPRKSVELEDPGAKELGILHHVPI